MEARSQSWSLTAAVGLLKTLVKLSKRGRHAVDRTCLLLSDMRHRHVGSPSGKQTFKNALRVFIRNFISFSDGGCAHKK